MLLSIHTMGAALFAIPELSLEQKEAAQLAEAIQNVAAFYDIPADPKTIAWVNLATTGMAIYGTRAFAYRNRMMFERRARLTATPTPAPAPQPQGARPNGVPTPATESRIVADALASHLGQPADIAA